MSEPTLPKLPPRGKEYLTARLAGQQPKEAALHAGFDKSTAAEAGTRMEAHPAYRAHFRVARLNEIDDAAILLFWADAMTDKKGDMQQRLKASELLARSRGMLVDRSRLEGKDGEPLRIFIAPLPGDEK